MTGKDDNDFRLTIEYAPEPPPEVEQDRVGAPRIYDDALKASRALYYDKNEGPNKAWQMAPGVPRRLLPQVRYEVRTAAKRLGYKVDTKSVVVSKGDAKADDKVNLYFRAMDAPEGYYRR